jgi:hypothetical protein
MEANLKTVYNPTHSALQRSGHLMGCRKFSSQAFSLYSPDSSKQFLQIEFKTPRWQPAKNISAWSQNKHNFHLKRCPTIYCTVRWVFTYRQATEKTRWDLGKQGNTSDEGNNCLENNNDLETKDAMLSLNIGQNRMTDEWERLPACLSQCSVMTLIHGRRNF